MVKDAKTSETTSAKVPENNTVNPRTNLDPIEYMFKNSAAIVACIRTNPIN
jgi:hypothetical protein